MPTFVVIFILISSIALIEVKILNVLGKNDVLPTFNDENMLVDNDILKLLVNRINENSEKITDLQKRLEQREEHSINENSEKITDLQKRLEQREQHSINENSEKITTEKRLQQCEDDIEKNNRETKILKAGLLKKPELKRYFKTHFPLINEENEKNNDLYKSYFAPLSEKSDNFTWIQNKSFITGQNKSINVIDDHGSGRKFPYSFAHSYKYLKYADKTNWKRIGGTINRQFGALSGLFSFLASIQGPLSNIALVGVMGTSGFNAVMNSNQENRIQSIEKDVKNLNTTTTQPSTPTTDPTIIPRIEALEATVVTFSADITELKTRMTATGESLGSLCQAIDSVASEANMQWDCCAHNVNNVAQCLTRAGATLANIGTPGTLTSPGNPGECLSNDGLCNP